MRLDQQMCYFCVIYPIKMSENTASLPLMILTVRKLSCSVFTL